MLKDFNRDPVWRLLLRKEFKSSGVKDGLKRWKDFLDLVQVSPFRSEAIFSGSKVENDQYLILYEIPLWSSDLMMLRNRMWTWK